MTLTEWVGVIISIGFVVTWRTLDCINKKLDRIIALAGTKVGEKS
jgi:hypothetical protein